MTYYFKSGNQINLETHNSVSVMEHLPVGTYQVKYNNRTEKFYLDIVPDMEMPSKIYGDVDTRTERILKSFEDRPRGTGVLLNGDKGSGKTLLAKRLSQKMRDRGYSTILVSEPHHGTEFNQFFSMIDVPVMIMFDEFEKVYHDDDEQAALLTMFDGTVDGKKLFVLTTNGEVDSHLLNRPGRMYYSFEYHGISKDFMEDYLNDRLQRKDQVEEINLIADSFSSFTFDMLQAMVEEINRFGCTAKEAMEYLNLDLSKEELVYEMDVYLNNAKVKNNCYPVILYGNPLIKSSDSWNQRVEINTHNANKESTFKEEDNIPMVRLNKESFKAQKNGGVLVFEVPCDKGIISVNLIPQKNKKLMAF